MLQRKDVTTDKDKGCDQERKITAKLKEKFELKGDTKEAKVLEGEEELEAWKKRFRDIAVRRHRRVKSNRERVNRRHGRRMSFKRNRRNILVTHSKVQVENGRIMRWALFLQSYRFRLEAIKGKENVGADYLSRQYRAEGEYK